MNASIDQDMLPFYLQQDKEVNLFEHAFRHQLPVLIKGPTGCGKTRFVRHMAAKLNVPLFTVSCHDDLTATDLVGRHLLQEGDTVWNDGPLTRAVRGGGICYLDEIVEARKDTTVVLHPLSDDRRELPIERTGESLSAPDNFMLVVSYNPGYQNIFKGMKPSTRQRFVALRFDFPKPDVERQIIIHETGANEHLANQLVQTAVALRRLQNHDVEETVSTRLLVYCASLIGSGMAWRDACRSTLAEPLSDDESTVNALMDVIVAIMDA
jgi:nitric oxide reductase NorQ protein